jgi:hypothetical protein
MIRIARPGGLVIITCASLGRPTHGTIDSDDFSSPFTTNYYKNLGVHDITKKIATGLYFTGHGFEIDSLSKDLYFWGIRSESGIQDCDHYWEDPISRLARAQGQLGQAATRHAAVQAELDTMKAEAEQARAEAEQARAEAEQARAEAEQARAEVEQIVRNSRNIQESRIWKLTGPIRRALDSSKRFLRILC